MARQDFSKMSDRLLDRKLANARSEMSSHQASLRQHKRGTLGWRMAQAAVDDCQARIDAIQDVRIERGRKKKRQLLAGRRR